MNVILRTDAETDIERAFRWYENRRPGLGEKFLEQVEDLLRKIEATPRIYPVGYRGLRRALMRKFPYSLYFLVDGDSIVVFRLLHQRRLPSIREQP